MEVGSQNYMDEIAKIFELTTKMEKKPTVSVSYFYLFLSVYLAVLKRLRRRALTINPPELYAELK